MNAPDIEPPATGRDNGHAPELLREALSELQAHHEELLAAEEEMVAQNEALAQVSAALDVERRRYRDLFHSAPEPSLLTDLSGVIQEANAAAHELLGVGPQALKRKPLAAFVAPDSRRTFRADALGRADVWEHSLYLQPRRGPLLYVTVRVSSVPGGGDAPVGLRWVVRGSTPDPGAELVRYWRLVDEVRDFAIFTHDAHGRITSWNAGAEAIFGWTADEAVGQSSAFVFTPEDRAEGAPEQERATAATTGRAADERWHLRKDGSRLWASGVLTAMPDGGGGAPWYAKIVRDLTERRRHEQREHAVATQLQAAVQPAAPSAVPGLALRTFYRPAHQDLSVGGDFFDVFGLGDGRTVLSVGDVSGKGLEAAAQVATVRNMLRFALYNGRTLAGPVASLNRTLAEQGLLTGFVTLFVGVYDPAARSLTYVNCGQEPGLLRRAGAARVERLSATGPLLGMEAEAAFAERSVTLAPGDAVVVFTDGLTDMGPSRTQMLQEEGVAALLQGDADAATIPGSGTAADGVSAERTADRVLAGLTGAVEAQDPRCLPDDVCLLVAVAE